MQLIFTTRLVGSVCNDSLHKVGETSPILSTSRLDLTCGELEAVCAGVSELNLSKPSKDKTKLTSITRTV